jgi:flavin reductase (DIM6/NTAB) family NADH-FMN oxidoreductase RutF
MGQNFRSRSPSPEASGNALPVRSAAPDAEILREALSRFPAGVVVVTANGADDTPAGLTVSAFCSVSAEPPLVLVCVDKKSNTLPAIQRSGRFTVNVLGAGRESLALVFASKRPDKFAACAWQPCADGGPILCDDSAAYLVCTVHEAVEAGDHWVFIGAVVRAAVEPELLTLMYHRRAFSVA